MGRISSALKKAEQERERYEKYHAERSYVAKTVEGEGIDAHVIAHYDSKSSVAEQYRSVRTNFFSIAENAPMKNVVFASANEGEGKTLSLLNLAVSIAVEMNRSVLVVDANLKKPELHQLLDIDVKKGLADYLKNGLSLKDIVIKTKLNNLSIIAAGGYCPNSVELLDSDKMKTLIDKAGKEYDHVFYDSPAVVPYTDVSVLGPKVDGVILSVEMEVTSRKVLDRALSILKESRVKVLGTILTKAKYHIPELIYKYL